MARYGSLQRWIQCNSNIDCSRQKVLLTDPTVHFGHFYGDYHLSQYQVSGWKLDLGNNAKCSGNRVVFLEIFDPVSPEIHYASNLILALLFVHGLAALLKRCRVKSYELNYVSEFMCTILQTTHSSCSTHAVTVPQNPQPDARILVRVHSS